MARQNFFFFFLGPLLKKFAHHWSRRRRAGFSCATLYKNYLKHKLYILRRCITTLQFGIA